MKKLLFLFAFALFLATLPELAKAAPDGDPQPAAVPIDGGVGFLAAAGVAYGVKKYRDLKKDKA